MCDKHEGWEVKGYLVKTAVASLIYFKCQAECKVKYYGILGVSRLRDESLGMQETKKNIRGSGLVPDDEIFMD